MKKNRQKHTAPFKAQVALEAMREQSTVAEIGRRYKINPNLVHKWKKEAVARLAVVSNQAMQMQRNRRTPSVKLNCCGKWGS